MSAQPQRVELDYESAWQLPAPPRRPLREPLEDVDWSLEIAERRVVGHGGAWDRLIATRTYALTEPDPVVAERLGLLRNAVSPRILDLGCGLGRHTVLLAREGFQTHALDISPSSVATTRDALHRADLPAIVTTGEMKETGYADAYFDALLAWRVLYLGTTGEVQLAFSEVSRIVRSDGRLLAAIRSTNNTLRHVGRICGREIEPETFRMNCDGLRGVVYHFFTEEEVCRRLPDFEILELNEQALQHTEYTARYPRYENLFWLVLARKR